MDHMGSKSDRMPISNVRLGGACFVNLFIHMRRLYVGLLGSGRESVTN